jgi:myb proto-oncogene protein
LLSSLSWCNQFNPSVKRGQFTEEEDKPILAAHAISGNKWAVIWRSVPGR